MLTATARYSRLVAPIDPDAGSRRRYLDHFLGPR